MKIIDTARTTLTLCVFLAMASITQALSLSPTPPLAERVKNAETVFVGTLINRTEDGDWVRAELRVDEPLHNAKVNQAIPVIWRRSNNGHVVYDAESGKRGIAILKNKHEGRYWLRADTYEPLTQLAETKRVIASNTVVTGKQHPPTYQQWLKDGKKLPPGRMFLGGTPWFNERTGTKRTPQEVYAMLYGGPAATAPPKPQKAIKPANGGRFPAHWGQPPRRQTRDLRPLPGGYGRGSGTLAKWIQTNLDKDAKNR